MGLRQKLNKSINSVVSYYLVNYRKMVFIPIAVLILLSSVVAYHYYVYGSPINPDISLSGGLSASVSTSQSVSPSFIISSLSSAIKQPVEVSVLHAPLSNSVIGYTITTTDSVNSTVFRQDVASIFHISPDSSSISMTLVAASLAQSSLDSAIYLLIIAFGLVALVSFFYFRNGVQAFSNVISIISDVINIIAVVDILGLRFSTASIAGILMIMGYSADRNIILATNILKRKDATVKYRLAHTIKTSLTMDAAAFVTFLILIIGSTNSTIISIATVLIIGVLFDDFTVWILNGSIQLAGIHYNPIAEAAA
ncbi:hypothetical protein M1293_00600 [Candidatus Parvarchaeota archaeon]|nr:hypothetical protein [Candidatus Parvarchaeota archaeon]